MDTNFFLMRKNDPITVVTLDERGQMVYCSEKIINEELAPLQYRYRQDRIKNWWNERAVPISQGHIREFLEKQGYSLPSEYLKKNLGLSLTDYYWIKPVDSSLTWETVNLFDNGFKEDILLLSQDQNNDPDNIPHYSPNGSLQGQIEKTWTIIDHERYLVKGNSNNLSSESINEVIASEIHKRQGYSNYTSYKLIRIRDSEYDFGCYSKLFTSQKQEFISAHAIVSSAKQDNSTSRYEHFIRVCKDLGMDEDALRFSMEYEIMTDFIISEYDRHLNNFGVLRDADSLQLLKMAPVYDSGGSMFAGKAKPRSLKELLNLKTNGLTARELDLVMEVKDPNVVDLTKLPPASYIKEMYETDSQISEAEINVIAELYERKIDICRQVQLGKNPLKEMYSK